MYSTTWRPMRCGFASRITILAITDDQRDWYVAVSRYLVSASGRAPDPRKVSVFREMPIPKNVKELRRFIGLASYFRSFITQFAEIATPLLALLRKGVSFDWYILSSCRSVHKLRNSR